MKKVIIDTDPGIDDAMALCYAIAHPQLDVVAMTSIFGNVSNELAARNALRLCNLTGVNIPVAVGASKPLEITPHPHADFVHGTNGFGDVELATGEQKTVSASAAELIVEQVRAQPSEITIIAVGPLTNLALALSIDPEITELVKEVIVMGGVFDRAGNVTPYAEANIWNDPHAAKQVLTANWPLTIHGLDVTYQIAFDKKFLKQVASVNPVSGGFLSSAAEFYIKFYEEQHNFSGCCPHDLLAVVYATNPQWFDCEAAIFDVITSGEQIGRTLNIIDNKVAGTDSENTTGKLTGGSNKKIAKQINKEALLADYLDILAIGNS